jgi:inner membrane protein
MTNTSEQLSLFERFNAWMEHSIMIKLLSIGFLTIILLIPSSWINSLIQERYSRSTQVFNEISAKWSGPQTLTGPILTIPYKHSYLVQGENKTERIEEKREAFFLPHVLHYDANVTPSIRHRGMFDAVVYITELNLTSTFSTPDFNKLGIDPENVIWEEARITFGITDLRGISESPTVTLGNDSFLAEQVSNIGVLIQPQEVKASEELYPPLSTGISNTSLKSTGVEIKPGWKNALEFKGDVTMKLNLKGSKTLNFIPVGKTTTVSLQGDWNNPSYTGEFLPVHEVATENSFEAQWKILDFNRPFQQQWLEKNEVLENASFGVTLLVPVEQYQKSIRTAKYGMLIVLLTFISLLLTEIIQRIKIHPFQYILIGSALIIYYTLLLSLAEHIGFNWAYCITSISTIILIGLYSLSFTRNRKVSLGLSGLLTIFYTFIFIIVLQQDYSLLIGSIGLFITIGVLMYTSRRINWYQS